MKESSESSPLPLRCEIESGESLNGFLLRLAERNGRRHPRELLGRATRPIYPGYGTDRRELEPIAVLSGQSLKQLVAISMQIPDARVDGEYLVGRYMGQLLSSHDLLGKWRAVCPGCMKEKPFHRARWDLLALGDCARHRTQLVSHCPRPECSLPFDWDRCGTARCRCGHPFPEIVAPPARDDRLDVAAYLERRMDGDSAVGEPRLLEALPLYRSIRVMLLLGALRMGRAPWRAHYNARDPARHDVVSVGFALSANRPEDLAELFELLPEFYDEEPWHAHQMLDRYGWLADHENHEVRQLGALLVQLSQATAQAHPRRHDGGRWRYP